MSNLPTEEELEAAVHEVIVILGRQNQEELGWIYSSTRHSVNYQGQPELNRKIQARIDNAIGGVSIVYIFALLETYINRELWEYADDGMRKKMYAYLHIRNTVAHGFDGKRAERYADKFDDLMTSGKPINGIKSFNDNEIIVEPNIWIGLKDFIPKFLASILHKVVNYGFETK
jgi:hypothetical protein